MAIRFSPKASVVKSATRTIASPPVAVDPLPVGFFLLLENGDKVLLENSSKVLLEAS